jgi:type IV secretory pathway VirD2 relaxase
MTGQPIILRHTYTRSRDTARAGLRYYQMRPRGDDEPPRSIFGAEGTMARDEAYRLLDQHQAHGYLAHRLMLSPPEDLRPDDLRDFTRHVLRELERDKGRCLHWVAVEHRNTIHPHVHIVLAGGAGEGHRRELRLDRADHARIKEDGLDYCRLTARVRDDWDRALAAATREADAGREAITPPVRGRDEGWERG